MEYSYTFHISSKKNAINNHQILAGKVNKHNLRAYSSGKGKPYDKEKTIVLIGNGKSIVDDVKAVYHREFDDALKKYNKGKRKDRVISDYYEHISSSRADLAVEIIIQLGNHDFWRDKSFRQWTSTTNIFKAQLRYLSHILPDFKIANATLHLDERDGSPHVHVIGVPVASGYKKGILFISCYYNISIENFAHRIKTPHR